MKTQIDFRTNYRFPIGNLCCGITANSHHYFNVKVFEPQTFQKSYFSHESLFFVDFDFARRLCVLSCTFSKGNLRNAVVFEFTFENINFVNIWNDDVMVSYKYPAKERLAKWLNQNGSFQSSGEMPLDFSWENHGLEPMHETLRNCSAFIFATGGNLSSLKEMLLLARITLKSEFIIVEHFPIEKYQALPQNENYYFEMLKSLGYPGKYLLCKNYFVIKTSSSEDMVNMWYHVMKDRSLRDYFPLISYIRMFPIHGKYIIRKVIITPTRRILTPPTQTPFCPIFRHVDHKKIIEVSFEDDDGNVMFGSKRLSPLARYTCSNGIEIAGEIYHEFGSSNSKFCKRGSYFYRGSKEEILSILKTLGKFERALPAKIAARIGLNFTSVLEGLFIHDLKVEDDIMSADGKYNFTDGCGQMSRNFAVRLMEHLKWKRLPIAIQFRYPGCKGVLVLDDKLKDYSVVLRKSQQKVLVSLNDKSFVDVIKMSAPASCRLNKNLIEILCQNAAKHGKTIQERVEARIKNLYDISIQSAIDAVVNPAKFVETLKWLPKYMDYSQMKSYDAESLQSEAFLRQMVQADVLTKLKFITEKQQVNIPDNLGRTALGAADFHGYLKPGQVFFRYSKEVDAYCEEKLVHVGPIAITRSPTLSLGDIQFVEAVDVPELHHIVDVLIFPTCGDRPIQDKISSGDLDGDEYFIFWDPELLLPYSQPPSEFTHPMPSRFDTIEIDQIQDHFPKFREEYMQKDNVGAISNSLTVFGELLGYDNLNVRRLAEKVDIALTYFKTGILAPNLEPHELSLFDPNHMLKEWKPMYSLKNVIGSFYDINGINVLEIQEILESDCSKPKMDELIDFPGWEKWKARAYMNFTTFKIEIDVLLCQNHLKSIGELFSNRIFKYLIRGQDIENLSAISPAGFTQKLIYDLTKKNREQALMKFIPGFTQFLAFKQNGFSSIYPPGILDDLKKYAVACYKIAYEDGKYLAFPWILWDVIDNVRSANKLQSTVGSINIPLEKLSISDNQSEIPPELQKIMDNFQKHCSTPLTDKGLSYLMKKFLNSKKCVVNDKSLVMQIFIQFCQCMGLESYDFFEQNSLQQFADACRLMVFKYAFELNLSIFDNLSIPSANTLKIARFTFEVNFKSSYIPSMEKRFLQITKCEQLIINLTKNKKSSMLYQVFALGNNIALKKLKDILTIEITKEHFSSFSNSHEKKVNAATTKFIQNLKIQVFDDYLSQIEWDDIDIEEDIHDWF